MRTKLDINSMQCDRCGKITKKTDDLFNCDIECKYEDLAICYQCYEKIKTENLK